MRLFLAIISFLILASCDRRPVVVFTKAPQAPFNGASAITPNANGTFTLTWKKPPIAEKLSYKIFIKDDTSTGIVDDFVKLFYTSEAGFATPYVTVKNTTWTSPVLLFKPNTCFVVRVVSKRYKDKNIAEICTRHTQYTFAGIQGLTDGVDNIYTLSWSAIPLVAATYDIFMRNESGGLYNYNKPFATGVTGVSYTSASLSYDVSRHAICRRFLSNKFTFVVGWA